MEDNIAPNLSQAYRLGRLNNPARVHPRDIIITFMNIRDKNRIQEFAKDNGHIWHFSDRIQVYPDLAPETLKKRKE